MLFWSLAFLHRQRTLKVVGAVSLVASAAPLATIVVGHIAVGLGAALGVGSLLAAAGGAAPGDLGFVTLVERLFGLWSYGAAWLMWRCPVQAPAPSP